MYSELLITDLASQLESGTPVGLTDDQWQALKPQVESMLDQARTETETDAKLNKYVQCYRKYLTTQVIALLAKLEDQEMITDKASKSQNGEVFKQEAQALAAKLRETLASLSEGNLDRSYQQHLQSLSAWQALNATLPVGDKMNETETTRSVPVAQASDIPSDILVPIIPALEATAQWDNVEKLILRTKTMDILIDGVAIAVSVIIGVRYVWEPNPIWGGLADYLNVFLWGLGLQQVSGYTFDGVLSIREKLFPST